MAEFDINYVFFIAGLLLTFAILASKLSSFFGTPLLLLFLGIGMMTGEDGFIFHIKYNDYTSSFFIANAMLALILLDGGLRTSFSMMKNVAAQSTLLATVGVILTAGITGLIGYVCLPNITLPQAMLLGCIIGSTDAAAVFAILGRNRDVSLKASVSSTLEIESATNDPMAILLTTVMIAVVGNQAQSFLDAVILLVTQFGLGIILGLFFGLIARLIIDSITLSIGLYSLLVIGFGFIGFSVTASLNGSGFLAIYIIGMCVGNQRSRQVSHILPVAEGITWLAQITLFLMLGLLVSPHEMVNYVSEGIVFAVAITFIARPLATFLCLKPFFRKTFNTKDIWFISWVGLRGSVPIVLAIYPVFSHLENPQLYFNVAFVVVIVSLLLQGTTLGPVSKLLKVYTPSTASPITKGDVGIMLSNDYELFNYEVKQECLNNEELRAITFPKGTTIAALFRDGKLIKARGDTVLNEGDIVSIIGRDADEPMLNSLFSHNSKPKRHPLYHGDKIYDASIKMQELAKQFNVELTEYEKSVELCDFMAYHIGGFPQPGDFVNLINIVLVVVDLEGDKVKRVGVYLAAEKQAEFERFRKRKLEALKREQKLIESGL